jgi:hypothetical protein
MKPRRIAINQSISKLEQKGKAKTGDIKRDVA